jgi:hypothetical protein
MRGTFCPSLPVRDSGKKLIILPISAEKIIISGRYGGWVNRIVVPESGDFKKNGEGR